MKCRILYVVGQLGTGGSERQLYLLLRHIDRNRYRPQVIVWNFRETDTYVQPVRELNIPLHCFPSAWSKLAKLRALRELVLRLNPEVIHSYSFYTNILVSWAALGTKAIAIGGVRSNFADDTKHTGVFLG